MAERDDQNDSTDNDGTKDEGTDSKTGTAAGSNGDGAGTEGTGAAGGSGTDDAKTDTEAEKWKKLSRQNEKNLREAQKKIDDFENKALTESQRLEKERDGYRSTAESASSQLKHMNVAIEHAPAHATLAQLRKVARRLSGKTDDELEADAKELWEDFAPTGSASTDATGSKTGSVAGKPKERLKGGADPSEELDEMNPAKIVANIPRAR